MQIFTLQRKEETPQSTWGELSDPSGAVLCKILERGLKNFAFPRVDAGLYTLARKAFGASHFDAAFRAFPIPGYKGILWLPNVPGRSNIEIHTANLIQQLEGCLATGEAIERDSAQNFMITGGTSKPAYATIYPMISAAIDADGAQIEIKDISA